MDFTKAFDKVPHQRLISKLQYYGVQGETLKWIKSFFLWRKQWVCVVADGKEAEFVDVLSGVPQGTVLDPVLFLLFINDLPDRLQSSVRLFADNCILYHPIKHHNDVHILQGDLDMLAIWEETWQMDFNPSKWHVIHVSHSLDPKYDEYSLRGHTLDTVEEATYLGVTLTSKLNWTPPYQEYLS